MPLNSSRVHLQDCWVLVWQHISTLGLWPDGMSRVWLPVLCGRREISVNMKLVLEPSSLFVPTCPQRCTLFSSWWPRGKWQARHQVAVMNEWMMKNGNSAALARMPETQASVFHKDEKQHVAFGRGNVHVVKKSKCFIGSSAWYFFWCHTVITTTTLKKQDQKLMYFFIPVSKVSPTSLWQVNSHLSRLPFVHLTLFHWSILAHW